MQSAMSKASDEEIISAIKELEGMKALEQVHLQPTHEAASYQKLGAPYASHNQELLAQAMGAFDPAKNVTSLQNPSLNL